MISFKTDINMKEIELYYTELTCVCCRFLNAYKLCIFTLFGSLALKPIDLI